MLPSKILSHDFVFYFERACFFLVDCAFERTIPLRKKVRKKKYARMLVEWIVLRPLRTLFTLGPAWIGGWGGQDPPDICAQLTASPAAFWQTHPTECGRIVAQKIDANIVVFATICYFWVLFSAVSLCFRFVLLRWTLTRPLALLANAASIGIHSADTLQSQTYLRLRSAAGRPPPRLPDSDTPGIEPARSELR